MDWFTSWYGEDEKEEVFGEDSEYDENRKVPGNQMFIMANLLYNFQEVHVYQTVCHSMLGFCKYVKRKGQLSTCLF